MQLTQKELDELRKQGYSDSEISTALGELEKENLEGSYNNTKSGMSTPNQYSKFGANPNNDIVKWQLELNDILEKAEHILRGDIVTFENNNIVWKPNPNADENTLNEFGVMLIMKCLSNYINRNTILADYTDQEIREKVFDFGRELNNLIFMKYEEMGMDDENKRKEYPMLVLTMKDIVHSAYSRAKDGGERRSLREMINISQSQLLQQGGMQGNNPNQPMKRGLLNPMRYIAGKYV